MPQESARGVRHAVEIKMKRITMIGFFGVATLFICTALSCQGETNGLTYSEVLAINLLNKCEQEILEMIDNAPCNGTESCRYIAFGDKPCGGPWKYLIYSIENVDTVQLRLKVSEYNRLNREANEKFGWDSDCSFEIPPSIGCNEGRCVEIQ